MMSKNTIVKSVSNLNRTDFSNNASITADYNNKVALKVAAAKSAEKVKAAEKASQISQARLAQQQPNKKSNTTPLTESQQRASIEEDTRRRIRDAQQGIQIIVSLENKNK